MDRYICIHGHFYQPPRENAWLEAVEIQDSAYPYHDWNERITAECYATNAASRILGEEGDIVQIVNNYANMSFNFGPTLLAWMEKNSPSLYEAILEADAQSREHFSGHGSAIAQAYNHMILPLANPRDKKTQVIWGIRDFEYRFGRKPEGIWLPETAVDLETLDVAARHGIRFTILAPHQAKQVRKIGDDKWDDISGSRIDPTMPYIQHLPSGRTITLFFYDGPISRAVGFERLLDKGETFAGRLVGGFSDERTWPQIVHIATDGESYGHHHRHGDMALAYALRHIEKSGFARITNYGEYLERHPPSHEVEIFENTSWSCTHGIERWRSNCGCHSGSHPEWHQQWRAPLREAFDWLRDTLAAPYAKEARLYLKAPRAARNDYIQIILDRSGESVENFFSRHSIRPLSGDEKSAALNLLELQRHLMLMYTSCGWFFDDLSGIETVQVIQYAGRAIQLGREFFGDVLESSFLQLLERAKSNYPVYRDGRRIFEKFVKPAMVDLEEVAAHYAISSLFEDYPERTSISCYSAEREDYQYAEAGKAKLVVGRAKVTSEVTQKFSRFNFAVLHFGDHNLNCGVRTYMGEGSYRSLVQDLLDVFSKADFSEALRVLDKHFETSVYSLKSLFRDEQRKILGLILDSTLKEAEGVYRQFFVHHIPLIRFLKDSGIPTPKSLYAAAELVLNADLRRAFEEDELDYASIKILLEEAELSGISLDTDTLEYALRKNLERMAESLLAEPTRFELLEKIEAAFGLVGILPFELNARKIQNIFYGMWQSIYPVQKEKAEKGDYTAGEWIGHFSALSKSLSIRIE